ncbi:MAG TPA: hypothetical protein VH477_15085 [Bryobacteraceae bacterium]
MPTVWTDREIKLLAERAYQLHLQGKYLDAAIIFEGLLAIDPRNIYCLQALSALNLKLGSIEDALGYANRALALLPEQVDALACRCEVNIQLKRFAAAQQDLRLLQQLRADAHVARLTMRIDNAEKFSTDLLSEATSQQLGR